ncbi:hypothetical protein MNQ95_12160 [Pseudoxanthomonas daejeonensis]|uniref:Uncharacterized protein n=1 Tax=Pseudoxanthomonas daejeonensis TaxID=266062 RepID=A0ABQ6Z5L2_9GAMM|nr:hypothetical protein [Pseudoxanthomonas daejeonensis]KAF1693777.1 hypothetical protein CSC65_10860 [Pseudoxanthomonas daejeonensis]UNK56891.1 hypothetical protein MNQ95_12160 [Pseudoxanthomonas daejeonensis]
MPQPRRTPRILLVLGALLAFQANASIVPALAPSTDPDTPGAERTCGLVGAQTAPTPESMDIFPARIMQINGERPRLVRDAYRMQPGRHVLVLAEGIPPYRLGSAQQKQILRMQQRKDFTGYFKPLVIEVRADTLQRVGVRLVRDNLDTGSIRENAYWEPVVWEEVARACK